MRILGLAAPFLLLACGSPPTEDECRDAVDHYLAMSTADPPRTLDLPWEAKEALRGAVVARRKEDASYMKARRRCVAELSHSELECLKQAPSAELWEACIE